MKPAQLLAGKDQPDSELNPVVTFEYQPQNVGLSFHIYLDRTLHREDAPILRLISIVDSYIHQDLTNPRLKTINEVMQRLHQ
jgi:hypothetical protein